MKRYTEREAREILREELKRVGYDTISAFTIQEGARPGANELAWWHANTPDNESADTERSLGYLRAYERISGGRMFAGGLFLERKRLWMDRSVMSRLERDGFVSFEGEGAREPWFALTARGCDWTAKGS